MYFLKRTAGTSQTRAVEHARPSAPRVHRDQGNEERDRRERMKESKKRERPTECHEMYGASIAKRAVHEGHRDDDDCARRTPGDHADVPAPVQKRIEIPEQNPAERRERAREPGQSEEPRRRPAEERQ